MRVIWLLVCRHMKLSKKRVISTALCIIISVVLFIFITGAMFIGAEIMEEAEIEQNGAYHVKFQGLTKEQGWQIGNDDSVAECRWTDSEKGGCAEVIFAQADDSIFEITQELAEKAGMVKLPEKEQTEYLPDGGKLEYDIVYHYDLLTMYGVSNPNGTGISVYKIGAGILIMLSLVFAAFIYNSFEVSLYEGRKYLGLLECIGADALQKGAFLFMEALSVGIVSILAGTVLGCSLFIGTWKAVQNEVQAKMQLTMPIPFHLNGKMIMIAVICGLMTVILACLIPVYKASGYTAAELLRNEKEKDFRAFNARKYNKRKSMEFNLALRNMQCGKKKVTTTILILAVTVVFVVNGFVWIHMSEGDYLLKDRREKQDPDKWVDIFSEDPDTCEHVFEGVEKLNPQGETCMVSSLSVGSVVFPQDILKVGKDEFLLYGLGGFHLPGQAEDVQGTTVTGYGFDTVIVGLDEKCFDAYSKKIGISDGELEKGKEMDFPFIIENYLLTDRSGKEAYGAVMDEKQGKSYTVSFSKYGDLNLNSAPRVDMLVNTDFYVIGATDQRPDIPISQEDYEYHVEAESQVTAGTIYLYTYMDKFNELITKNEFCNMIGVHPKETAAESYLEYNEVSRRIYFSAGDALTDSEWRERLSPVFAGEDLLYVKDDAKDGSDTWTYNSREMIDVKKKSNPISYFRTFFYYGILCMVTVFVLSGMFQYLVMGLLVRRKEFSVLESLGMARRGIHRLICVENVIPVFLAGIAGIAAAAAVMFGQFSEAGKYHAVEIMIPFKVMTGSVVVLAVFLAAVLAAGVRASEESDIVSALKNE